MSVPTKNVRANFKSGEKGPPLKKRTISLAIEDHSIGIATVYRNLKYLCNDIGIY